MSELQKFLRVFLKRSVILLLIFSPLLFYNIVLDPYGIFFYLSGPSRMEPNKRFMKLRYVLKNPDKFDSFIFGSSRANSIDPQNIRNGKYFNMTYSNGVPRDHYRDVKLMIRNGVQIKNLLIGIDFLSLLENPKIVENDLLRQPYPISLKDKFNFFKSYILFRPAKRVIDLTLSKKKNVDETKLYTSGIVFDTTADYYARFEPQNHVNSKTFLIPFGNYQDFPDVESAICEIDSLVRFARAHKININIYVNPTHVSSYININLDAFYDALSRLASVTDYYDFSGINSVTINNLYYHETSHFYLNVGDMIIDRVCGQKTVTVPDDFGYMVNKSNIEKHIVSQRKMVARYFEGTDPTLRYHRPVDLYSLRKSEKQPELFLDKINGLPVSPSAETMLIPTPLIRVEGRMVAEKSGSPSGKIFVKIGEKLFEVTPNKATKQLNTSGDGNDFKYKGWRVFIPSRFVKEGEQDLSLVQMNPNNREYAVTGNFKKVKVILQKKVVRLESLTPLDQKASLYVDFINGRSPGKFNVLFDNQHFINLKGWAIDLQAKQHSGGVIVYLDEKPFISQFIFERQDLARKMKPDEKIGAGWGIVIPVDSLEEGIHDLTFTVLNADLNGYFSSDLKYQFQYVKTEGEDLLKGATASDETTAYSVDFINETGVGKARQPIVAAEPTIRLSGWAVDRPGNNVAKAVSLEIDGKSFKAFYGFDRKDVARYLKSEIYRNSGWKAEIPASSIGKGEHKLLLKILANNKMVYYSTIKPVVFTVK
ncbi:MAG: hypothetical protein NTW16_08870 [Bacteroidetes bacterium]|nr:hypothetical protein [Bacteroidota bacterium]